MNQNDFNPDWDTVKAYQDKFDELMDEVQWLRAENKANRMWVGLTDDERIQIIHANTATGLLPMVKNIEAKLKEKNNG